MCWFNLEVLGFSHQYYMGCYDGIVWTKGQDLLCPSWLSHAVVRIAQVALKESKKIYQKELTTRMKLDTWDRHDEL